MPQIVNDIMQLVLRWAHVVAGIIWIGHLELECIDTPPDLVVVNTGIGFRGWLEAAEGWGLGDALRASLAVLALIEEEPYAEIADALDVPIGTVKSRVFRAIRALRQELTRLGIER